MDRYKDTKKISILAIIANIFLFAIKITVGVTSKSQGLLADAINSATDIFNSIMIYIGNKLASKPKDKEHPFGHGKVEYVFSLIVSIFMVLLSFKILEGAITAIIIGEHLIFSKYLIIVCVTTIIVKLMLYIYTSKIGKKYENLLIESASEDHRNDVLVTLSTLIGIVSSQYGFYHVDSVVGIGIAIWIAYVAFRLFISSYNVLIDTDINDTLKAKIIDKVNKSNNCTLDSIISKPIGVNYILLIEISVNEDVSLEEGHNIAEKIKNEVCKIEEIVDAIVHVNPKNNNI